MNLPKSKLVKNQRKTFNKTAEGLAMTVSIRHDDECGNGHNSFAITMDAYTAGKPRTDRNMEFCGSDEVKKHFPEFAHLIKWHLTSTDGPMHYVANTMHYAGTKDCWGREKGEPYHFKTAIKFADFPILKRFHRLAEWLKERIDYDLEVLAIEHKKEPGGYDFKPKYTFGGFADVWHLCPFDSEEEALEFLDAIHWAEKNGGLQFVSAPTMTGEGSAPELDKARRAAIWPDATAEQLTDKAALEARLPALMAEFKTDVEALGFEY